MYLLSPQFGVSWIFFFCLLILKSWNFWRAYRRKDRIVTFPFFIFKFNSYNEKWFTLNAFIKSIKNIN